MTMDFFLTSLIVVLLPGSGVIHTLAHGLSQGARASLLAAIGCTLGIVPHVAASLLGLAALLHASALAFQAIKLCGAAYLLFMAWGMLRQGGTLDPASRPTAASPRRIIISGVLVNILNPKLSLFFLAFLPQFIPAGTPNPLLRLLELALAFMTMTLVVFVGYGVFAATVRRTLLDRPAVVRWLHRGFAALFVALGLKLALAEATP